MAKLSSTNVYGNLNVDGVATSNRLITADASFDSKSEHDYLPMIINNGIIKKFTKQYDDFQLMHFGGDQHHKAYSWKIGYVGNENKFKDNFFIHGATPNSTGATYLFSHTGHIKISARGSEYDVFSTMNRPTAEDVGALPDSGGALTGNIKFRHLGNEFDAVHFLPGDASGHCLMLGMGGRTVIGSGESIIEIKNANMSTITEEMMVASDSSIRLLPGMQTGLNSNAYKEIKITEEGIIEMYRKGRDSSLLLKAGPSAGIQEYAIGYGNSNGPHFFMNVSNGSHGYSFKSMEPLISLNRYGSYYKVFSELHRPTYSIYSTDKDSSYSVSKYTDSDSMYEMIKNMNFYLKKEKRFDITEEEKKIRQSEDFANANEETRKDIIAKTRKKYGTSYELLNETKLVANAEELPFEVAPISDDEDGTRSIETGSMIAGIACALQKTINKIEKLEDEILKLKDNILP